ncbi:IS1595 family transposase [Brevundimonas balnearis]|uniref:IS1595 family transposase n=1 Tax=Brevundimonas balnearis TaxID=1572858 RepID=A0ABV6R6Q1_9CAUL
MNLLTIFKRFPDQEACIEYLEKVRWGASPHCPHCGAVDVARKSESERVGRWNCHACRSSFNVLAGTIFEKTKVPLQKWFLAIGLIVNAKKSLSSGQLARDLDLNQKTAWFMQQRIRAAMLTAEGDLLQGIVEVDETYVGGKPRKGNRRDDDKPGKRGRGTSKAAVVGAVERGGRVIARVADDLTGKGLLRFLLSSVRPEGTLLITDELSSYNAAGAIFQRAVINHKEAYAFGETHTNSIEGFWSLIKRSWYGSHHHYTRRFMPLFIAETCWKYNQRRNDDAFGTFMRGCFA